MEPNRRLPLMFAVLDGEASLEEARELELLLAGDPAARAEYEAFRDLFMKLQGIPMLDPPPGLAGAVSRRLHTLRSSAKEKTMTRSKRTLWIGTAVAAAAVVIVGAFFVDFPPGRQSVSGTVVPAQRYRAEQPKAEDVKLGDPAIAQLMQSESFERIIKDPKLRTLALDPGFQALARDPVALAAVMRNIDAVVSLARSPRAQDVLARSAARAAAMDSQARAAAMDPQARAAALDPQARATALDPQARINATSLNATIQALSNIPEARVAALNAPEAVKAMISSAAIVQAISRNPDALALMARDSSLASMATSPAFSNALATYASSIDATSTSAREK